MRNQNTCCFNFVPFFYNFHSSREFLLSILSVLPPPTLTYFHTSQCGQSLSLVCWKWLLWNLLKWLNITHCKLLIEQGPAFFCFISLCQPANEFSNLFRSLPLCCSFPLWFDSGHRALGWGLSGTCWDNESIFCSYITTISQKAQGASVVHDVVSDRVYSFSECSAEDCRLGRPDLFWKSSRQLRLTGKEKEQ